MVKSSKDKTTDKQYFQKMMPGKRTKILDFLATQKDKGSCLRDIENNTSITYKTLKTKVDQLEKVGMIEVLEHTGNKEPYVLTTQAKEILKSLKKIL